MFSMLKVDYVSKGIDLMPIRFVKVRKDMKETILGLFRSTCLKRLSFLICGHES